MTLEELQEAYNLECQKKEKRLAKKFPNDYFQRMIAEDFSVWRKYESRATELLGMSDEIYINSKY